MLDRPRPARPQLGTQLGRHGRLEAAFGAPQGLDFLARGPEPLGQAGPRPVSAFGHPSEDACIRITVNGEVRQDGSLDEMIWPIADIISHLSRLVTLAPGDLIFTGTPGGVGALQPGDRVHGEVAGVDEFDLEIVEK
jgi:fumarylpyruvate hydrolase